MSDSENAVQDQTDIETPAQEQEDTERREQMTSGLDSDDDDTKGHRAAAY